MLRVVRSFETCENLACGIAVHRVCAVCPAEATVETDLGDPLSPADLPRPGRLDLVLLARPLADVEDEVEYLREIGRSLTLEGRLAVFDPRLGEALEEAGFARVTTKDDSIEQWSPRNQW